MRISLPEPPEISPRVSAYLDLIRASAAFVVLQNHIRALFVAGGPWEKSPDLPGRAYDFLSAPGRQAVYVFFVLSGFFIAGSVFRMLRAGCWSWSEYLLQRLTRLWVVLLPALLLTICWDAIGQGFLGRPYDTAMLPLDHCSIGYSSAERLMPRVFLGNLAFLQSIRVPVFGSNGPLWSLSYEFWYYIAFPCLVLLLYTRKFWQQVVLIGVLLAIWLVVGKAILPRFGIWLLGAALLFLPYAPRGQRLSKFFAVAATVGFLVALGMSAWPVWLPEFVRDKYFIGVPCAVMVYGVLRLPWKSTTEGRFERGCKRLAGFSYSLYALHFPPLAALNAYFVTYGIEKWPFSPVTMLKVAGLSALIMVYAWGIALVTEDKTGTLRRQVRQRLKLTRAKSATSAAR